MQAFVGIDVSKSKLDICWLRDVATGKRKSKVFPNTPGGWALLYKWLLNNIKLPAHQILITLEPTGVYHENLIYGLHAQGFLVYLANPSKARQYAQSLNLVHKTDKIDAMALASYGHARHSAIELWEPEPEEVRQLKVKIRRLHALEKDLQRERNRKEAYQVGIPNDAVLLSCEQMISALEDQINKLQGDIDDDIGSHPQLKKNRELLSTIKGIGTVVSRELVHLFAAKQFSSAKQAAAYLGLIPKLKESGKQKGKVCLSKSGPAALRAKLYMSAIVATTHNADFILMKQRLLAAGKSKKAIVCAAMRKLVQICYGVIKHQSEYRPQMT